MEEVNVEESWNKKRILTALFLIMVLAIGGYVFKARVLDADLFPKNPKSVKGITSKEEKRKEDFGMEIQGAVKEKIKSLKQEVSLLNIAEIASSSPQVQKIINDIKSLEQYPTNQAKEICRKICDL